MTNSKQELIQALFIETEGFRQDMEYYKAQYKAATNDRTKDMQRAHYDWSAQAFLTVRRELEAIL